MPLRVYHTTIRYVDPDGGEVQIENPFIHHHNETLVGPGDPWLYARAATSVSGFILGARLGLTIPLGRTVPDPFALGDMGISHEHSQFGTGTVTPIVGIEASRLFGGVHVDATALTIQSVYANSHGYQAGDRYALALGASSALGTKAWRFRATVESIWETAETWGGVVHMDDGNIGRTDVLIGAEATWQIDDDWHVGLSVKLPAYTHVEGGQLDALGFAGLSVGTHFHVFGDGDDHDHADHGDHDDDDEAPPADWTGLDKIDVASDGKVVPLEPAPGKVTVFDFWATWCHPCRHLDRALADVARRHPDDLAVRKIDLEDTDSPAGKAYLGAATLPHVKVFGRDGTLLWERSAPPLELAAAVEAVITGAGTPPPPPPVDPAAPKVAIEVGDHGYAPARVEIEHGKPATLVFTRTSDKTCAVDVHFVLPDGTRVDRELPLGQAVEIPILVAQPGEIRYACGMDMEHGTIIVR